MMVRVWGVAVLHLARGLKKAESVALGAGSLELLRSDLQKSPSRSAAARVEEKPEASSKRGHSVASCDQC